VSRKVLSSIVFLSALNVVLFAGLGLSAQTAPPAPQPAAASMQDEANELSVAVGKTVLVDTALPIKRVALGLGEIAEVHATSPTEVMVSGKAPGETSLIIWDAKGGRQFFNVTVRQSSAISDDSLEGIRRELRLELPGQPIKLTVENGTIFIRGTVKNLNASERAIKIVSTGGKVVNLLDVEVPPSQPQILLKVRFESVDRTKEIQAGINLFSSGFGNVLAGTSTGQFSPPTISAPTPGSPATVTLTNQLNLFAFLPGLNVGATLEALEGNQIAQVSGAAQHCCRQRKGSQLPRRRSVPLSQCSRRRGGRCWSGHHRVQGVRCPAQLSSRQSLRAEPFASRWRQKSVRWTLPTASRSGDLTCPDLIPAR
jgi:pilus assembly protein CpaC